MYQNIITDVFPLNVETPTSLSSEEAAERYWEIWKNSPVYIYITPKDIAAEYDPVILVRGLAPTYNTIPSYYYTCVVPLNVNMWNPIAFTFDSFINGSSDITSFFSDYYIFLGRTE